VRVEPTSVMLWWVVSTATASASFERRRQVYRFQKLFFSFRHLSSMFRRRLRVLLHGWWGWSLFAVAEKFWRNFFWNFHFAFWPFSLKLHFLAWNGVADTHGVMRTGILAICFVSVAICWLSEEWKLSLVIYHYFLRSFNWFFFLLKFKPSVDAFVQGLQVRLIIQIFLGFFPDRW